MAILNFQKPDKIILQKATDFEAQFEFRPLEPGYAVTIGNALRRVLLSSLEGYAITGVKIEGVDHEFATIKGVSEDVVEILLNLKQVRLRKKVDHEVAHERILLTVRNRTELTAGMIGEATLAMLYVPLFFYVFDRFAERSKKKPVESPPPKPAPVTEGGH